MHIQKDASSPLPEVSSASCPVDHAAWSRQKTALAVEPVGTPIERDTAGVWHIRGFEEARAILRNGNTQQAGFRADLIQRVPHMMNQPILYQEGKVHHQQRKQTARFFTPKTVSANYRQLMEAVVDQLMADFQRKKRVDLSKMSLTMAVRVAGKVIGLTDSLVPGMAGRLEAFFDDTSTEFSWHPRAIRRLLGAQQRVAAFFFLDVKPAIQKRKRKLQEDVISYLIGLNYRDSEILTECITYAAAGMATTREFISVAAWHFLEQPALRARYLVASEEERYAMLEEMLRLEPVVGHLFRRTSADIHLESNGESLVIPQGEMVDIHVYGTNADEAIVGEEPLAVCPARELKGERVSAALMSFGDGHHRCPGSYVAIQETDIFLQRLLALDGLKIERTPTMTWSDITVGYELRNFIITVH